MRWLYPIYLWAEWLPGLLACAWILSEWQLYHRFRNFCDPRVMGIITPWRYRIAAVLMLILGTAFAVALVAVPTLKEAQPAFELGGIQLMLDQQSLESRAGPFWEGLESSVQTLIEQIPGSRFSFSIAGLPPRVLVYPTIDTKGLLIILSGLRFAPQQAAKSDLGQVIQKQMELQAASSRTSPLAVITAQPIDEIERMAVSLPGDIRTCIFIHLPGDARSPQYGCMDAGGGWTWTPDPVQAGTILKMERTDYSGRLRLTQWMAMLALSLLCAEYVLAQIGRAGPGGYLRA